MPKQVEGTITLDQENPKVGDTVTFTVTGVRRGFISVATFGTEDRWAVRVPVGEPVTLGLEGLTYAWLDDNKNLTDGFVAAISFTIAPA